MPRDIRDDDSVYDTIRRCFRTTQCTHHCRMRISAVHKYGREECILYTHTRTRERGGVPLCVLRGQTRAGCT